MKRIVKIIKDIFWIFAFEKLEVLPEDRLEHAKRPGLFQLMFGSEQLPEMENSSEEKGPKKRASLLQVIFSKDELPQLDNDALYMGSNFLKNVFSGETLPELDESLLLEGKKGPSHSGGPE